VGQATRDRVRRCLPLSELARGLEPLTCCFSAGRVEALWQGVVVWRLALSDAAWTPIVFDHLAVAEPKVWGTSVGVSGVPIVYAAVMFRHAINCFGVSQDPAAHGCRAERVERPPEYLLDRGQRGIDGPGGMF
jgi:hypothetical protein